MVSVASRWSVLHHAGSTALITAGGGGSNRSELKELFLNLAMWRFGVTLVREISVQQTGQMEPAVEKWEVRKER